MVTSKQIIEELDIRSSRTLRRWADRGLLPQPSVRNVSTGRGRTSFWPDWVLPRCRRIRQLLKAGKSLDEIRDVLGTDWKAERAKSRQRYRFAQVSADLDRQAAVRNLAELIGNKLVPFLGGLGANVRDAVFQLDKTVFENETIENLLGLVRQGINPMLVYATGKFYVTPNFLVGPLVEYDSGHGGPFIAMPVFAEIVTAFSPVEAGLPAAPTISLVRRVSKTEANRGDEYTVHPVGLRDFELSKLETASAGDPAKNTSSENDGV